MLQLKLGNKLDLAILHGDGSNTVAKKGVMASVIPDIKHQRGEKELTLADNHRHVLAPLTVKLVNQHDTMLFPESFHALIDIADLFHLDLEYSFVTLDAGFDSAVNHELIRSYQLTPGLNQIVVARKTKKKFSNV